MSRLDSFIRRLTAQRDCLDHAARLIARRRGVVLELGLGNGRTYDHMRTLMPERDIYVFDRRVEAHPDCVPDAAHLFLGDIRETLPRALAALGAHAVLAHCDIGNGDRLASAALAGDIMPLLMPLLADGAIVVSDQPLSAPGLDAMALPDGVPPQRYFLWRAYRPS